MKQKIVIKVDIHCDKCRTKALKIAAKQHGVSSVAIEGAERDKVVVIGEGVDAATLTLRLGKKLHHASLELVEAVKPKPREPNFSMSSYPPMPLYTVVPCDNAGPNCIIM